jgi:hypothetical protein
MGNLQNKSHTLERFAFSTNRSKSLSSFSDMEWSSVKAETSEERELLK